MMNITISHIGVFQVLDYTPHPNVLIANAMGTCRGRVPSVAECMEVGGIGPVTDERKAGEKIVKHLLAGGRGHFGCFEHPAITFHITGMPHRLMQQLRTHRVGISFDVQSFRQRQDRCIVVANREFGYYSIEELEELFYVPLPSDGFDSHQRLRVLRSIHDDCRTYAQLIKEGVSQEIAVVVLPNSYRQDVQVSFNMRSLMHMIDLRSKGDASDYARQFCEVLMKYFKLWSPEVGQWYEENRLTKARLSP